MENTLSRATADIAAAYLSRNDMPATDVPAFLRTVAETLQKMTDTPVSTNPDLQKARVDWKSSVQPDYIVCLEDGKKLKMLKRHLRTYYNLSPEQYREKWGLPADYPMTAPNYAKRRAEIARETGINVRQQ